MATLRKKKYKSGKTVWVIDYTEKSRRKIRTIGNVDKRTAEKIFHRFIAELKETKFGIKKTKNITFENFEKEYINFSDATKSKRTTEREQGILKTFQTHFPQVKLADISNEDIRKYQLNRLKSVKSETVNLEFRHLKAIFNWAIDNGFLKENAFKGIKKVKTVESNLPRFFEVEDIYKIRNHFKDDPFEMLIEFYLLTGARLKEALYLKWEDIDFKRKQITIRSDNTKSKKHRIISFIKDKQLETLLNSFRRNLSGVIFFDEVTGNQWSSWWVSRKISVTLSKIGFPWASCHTFRHTYISHLIMNNVPLATVKEIVGHSSIHTTLKYAHLAPNHKNEMSAKRSY